jgi:lysophospholipase L1-like esterase
MNNRNALDCAVFLASFSLLAPLRVAGAAPPGGEDAGFYLRGGDRVVFYGDSITGGGLYPKLVELFVATRFPALDVSFINSGQGGDKVTGGGGSWIDKRISRDVFSHKPTVLTVMLGMNDGAFRPGDEKLKEAFARGYRRMLSALERGLPGAHFTLIQPSPYDDISRPRWLNGSYNAVMQDYGFIVRDLAAQRGHLAADFNLPVRGLLAKAADLDAGLAQKVIPDRVHPGPGAHLMMAAALLKAWNAPAIVSAAEIDGAACVLAASTRTVVTELRCGSPLSWSQLDAALPVPIPLEDETVPLALELSGFYSTLNRQALLVRGLKADRYSLKIDDSLIGTFGREELAAGINLASLPTPMRAQAENVSRLISERIEVRGKGWRSVQLQFEAEMHPRVRKAVDELVAAFAEQERELFLKRRAAAVPKARSYRLYPEGGRK